MAVTHNKKDLTRKISIGTGAPVHSAVAGDEYTDMSTGLKYQYTTSWVQAGAVIQTQTIYVDAQLGVNSSGSGSISSPYLTVEYALANTTNTGTFNGTTTNTAFTITGISDANYANLVVGQYITGTGIPYDSILVSKDGGGVDAKQITINRACTASATVTVTWWTVYRVICIGNFTATSSWAKAGFWIDSSNATVLFGNMSLFYFQSTVVIPHYIKLGITQGTHSGSRLLLRDVISIEDVFIDVGTYYSMGTGIQMYGVTTGLFYFRNLYVTGKFFDARFGTIGQLSGTYLKWEVDCYGLLGGITCNGVGEKFFDATITTPSAINAINNPNGSDITAFGKITGSLVLGERFVIYADVTGATVTTSLAGGDYRMDFYGNLAITTLTCGGMMRLFGKMYGNLVNNNVYDCTIFGQVTGTITCTSGTVQYYASGNHYHSLVVTITNGNFINYSYIATFSATINGTGMLHNTSGGYLGIATLTGTGYGIVLTAGKLINDGIIKYTAGALQWAGLISKAGGTFLQNGLLIHPNQLFVNYPTNSSPAKDVVLGYSKCTSYAIGNTNAGTDKSMGTIRTLLPSSVALTSVDINDGTNTVTITGNGATIALIVADMIANINASILQFQSIGTTSDNRLVFVGKSQTTTSMTSLVNCTQSTYAGGGGYTPNVLGGGTELKDPNFAVL